MMTTQREMAEWILDFFKRSNLDTGQIILMRNVQNKLLELNPRERDLFVPVVNELISNGYITYEEGTPQYLRLTQKGRDFIYSENAELDCFQDKKLTPVQERYVTEWRHSFSFYITQLKSLISDFLLNPQASDDDKRGLERCLNILNGRDVKDVEEALHVGNVDKGVLDKIEKLDKALIDEAVEHLHTGVIIKEFWRTLSYLKIAQEKQNAEIRLNLLKLPIS